MKDGHGRTIDYLRISLTDRCNLRCVYCMPEEGIDLIEHEDILRIEEIQRIVRVAVRIGIRSVRLTGGEPTVRRGIEDLISDIVSLPDIRNVSLTTNGILLPRMARRLREAGLSRVNISLDTLDRQQYARITRRDCLPAALAGIDAALEAGLDPVKINAVTVRSLNQDYFEFAKMSIDRPLHVRFIEYMPVGDSAGIDGLGWGERDVYPSHQLVEDINARAISQGFSPLEACDGDSGPIGWGPARYFAFPGAQGTVGVISPRSRHFCGDCNRLRLTAEGKLRPCLFSDREFDVRAALRSGGEEAVYAVFLEALGEKPDDHHDRVGTRRGMSQIGG
ncbi:GTP 3',8-cyclase MoaA [Gordonibacter sp. Marseille-P4307]|uniref:GTP 3',8-cyclase MoaA n=1 Tax=Gordonibacter sp. Marseille-P4307 TaxID=2161815 RepID=UPI000F53967C|nr:GTP 3',8-cyclase MoaA [Gordonibacter sp. Marseille-P4307]